MADLMILVISFLTFDSEDQGSFLNKDHIGRNQNVTDVVNKILGFMYLLSHFKLYACSSGSSNPFFRPGIPATCQRMHSNRAISLGKNMTQSSAR